MSAQFIRMLLHGRGALCKDVRETLCVPVDQRTNCGPKWTPPQMATSWCFGLRLLIPWVDLQGLSFWCPPECNTLHPLGGCQGCPHGPQPTGIAPCSYCNPA